MCSCLSCHLVHSQWVPPLCLSSIASSVLHVCTHLMCGPSNTFCLCTMVSNDVMCVYSLVYVILFILVLICCVFGQFLRIYFLMWHITFSHTIMHVSASLIRRPSSHPYNTYTYCACMQGESLGMRLHKWTMMQDFSVRVFMPYLS